MTNDFAGAGETLDHLLALLSATDSVVTFLKEVGLRGVSYGVQPGRNCYVLFEGSNESIPKVGIIEEIFLHSYTLVTGQNEGTNVQGIFMAVRELLPIRSDLDPYRSWGPFAGFLCTALPSQLRVIPSTSLISHFAPTRLDDPAFANMIHVMPLDRVSQRLLLVPRFYFG